MKRGYIIPLILISLILTIALSHKVGNIVITIISSITIIVGIIMTNIKQNYVFGLKTPWTMMDKDIWIRSNKICGYGYIISGLLMLLSIKTNILIQIIIIFILIMGTTFYSVYYSYNQFKKINIKMK